MISRAGSGTTSRDGGDPAVGSDERRIVLVAIHGAEAHVAPLEAGRPVVVGRDPSNDEGPTITIADKRVSRSHARWELSQGGQRVVVEDLGSRNGTWVGGRRAARAEVGVGDDVHVGGAVLRVQTLGGRVSPTEGPEGDGLVVGDAMNGVLEDVQRLASARVAVVLHGETGTGKELLAELLHELGSRRGKPLVKVNCAAVPPNLVEATFFGHERGAFTGAGERRRGVFEEADGGTVLLDEIGDLPLVAQGALLRVLDKGSFSRVGGVTEISVDVRVVAATHRDLEALVRAGQFRADLYHRLSAVVIELPPLRMRGRDLPALAGQFLRAASAANGGHVRGFDGDALELLCAYDWPGNVRELKNAVERAVVLARRELLSPDDFPRQIIALALAREGVVRPAEPPRSAPPIARADRAAAPLDVVAGREDAGAPSPPPVLDRAAGATPAPIARAPRDAGALPDRLRAFEAEAIRAALEASGGNRAAAAERLGVPLRTLARKIRALGVRG